MKFVEQFLSFQGEGIYAGYPAVFVRLATCNQNCKFCFVGSTQVNTLSGLKRLDQLEVGDKLITLNSETSKMEQTTVKNVTSRLTTKEEMLLVQIDRTKYWVTQEHPFWVVGRGWVPAHRLQVDDVVLYVNSSSYFMTINNPMKNSVTSAKVGQKIKLLNQQGLITYNHSAESRQRQSERMKLFNPMKNPQIVKKNAEAHYRHISQLEQKVLNFTLQRGLPLKYIGNNKLAIGDRFSGWRYPDFIVEGTKKLIEVYDTTMLYQSGYRDQLWEQTTQTHYQKFGYTCQFITEQDLTKQNRETLQQKLFKTCFNGKKVTRVDHLKSHQVAKLQEFHQSNKIRVYNLTTDKHTFLVNGVLVHNCDTRFSHSDQPETEVSKIVEQIKKHNPVNHLVITGGEPLLQQTEVVNLLLELKMSYSFITVETNGSLYPEKELAQLVDFFSVSPKLRGMAEYEWEPTVEQFLETLSYKMQLKFVVVTDEDYEELKARLQKISSHRLSKVPIVLQPNGMSDTLNAYVRSYGKLALRVANDPFWKDYNVRVLMQNHRVSFKQQSGV